MTFFPDEEPCEDCAKAVRRGALKCSDCDHYSSDVKWRTPEAKHLCDACRSYYHSDEWDEGGDE